MPTAGPIRTLATSPNKLKKHTTKPTAFLDKLIFQKRC